MADKKRERGKNYTEQDKAMLLNIVQAYTDIVENKKTDSYSVKLKCEAWDSIAEEYNETAQTGTRTGFQLKALYDGMKKKLKKDKAQEKIDGVPKDEESRDPLETQLEGIISNVTTEIVNNEDSNAPYHKTKKLKPSVQEEKEELKLDILRIRKDKESLTKDILTLKKKRLELKLKIELREARDKYGEDV